MKRPTPKAGDMALALSAARDAVGDDAALQRVRAGVQAKIATGAAPPAFADGSMAGAWVGKSLAALLFAAGAGALLYSPEPAPPLAATTHLQEASEQTNPQPPAPPAPAAQPTLTADVPAAPLASPPAVKRARRAVRATPAKPVPPTAAATRAPCSDAAAEVELISRAQQTLRSQPRAALVLLTEHEQRFSCGVLALERDTLRIDAERALGLSAEAEQHVRELVARYPESPETRALKKSVDAAAHSGDSHKTETVATPTP